MTRSGRVLVLASVIACVSAAVWSIAAAQPRGGNDVQIGGKRLPDELKERERRIELELAGIAREGYPADHWAHKWAAPYTWRMLQGRNSHRVVFAPRSGLVEAAYSGMFDDEWGSGGDIVAVGPDYLCVHRTAGDLAGCGVVYRLARWGNYRFITSRADQLGQLVAAYNCGHSIGGLSLASDPMGGDAAPWIAAPDGMEAVPAGRPELPAEYAKCLREGPSIVWIRRVVKLGEPHDPAQPFNFHRVEIAGDIDGVRYSPIFLGRRMAVLGQPTKATVGLMMLDPRNSSVALLNLGSRPVEEIPRIRAGQFLVTVDSPRRVPSAPACESGKAHEKGAVP